jgi:hypothetical protein
MDLSRKRPCIALAATVMLVAATSTPLSADPSQRNMDAVQAAVREMRDQLQAPQQFKQLPTKYMCKGWYGYGRNINDRSVYGLPRQARLRRATMRHATLTGRYGRADPVTMSAMYPYDVPIRCW